MTLGLNDEFSLGRLMLALGVAENLLADGALPIGLLAGLGAGRGNLLDLGQLVTLGLNDEFSLGRLMQSICIREQLAALVALPVRPYAGLGAGRRFFCHSAQSVPLNGSVIKSLDLVRGENGVVNLDLIDSADEAVAHRPALTGILAAIFVAVGGVLILIVAPGGLADQEITDLAQRTRCNVDLLHQCAVEIQTQLVCGAVQLSNNMIPCVDLLVAVVHIAAVVKLVVVGGRCGRNGKLLIGLFVDHAAAAVRLGRGEGDGKAAVHPDVLPQRAARLKCAHRAAGLVINAQNGHSVAVFKVRVHPEADGHFACGIDLRGEPRGVFLGERELGLLDMAAAVEVERTVFLRGFVGGLGHIIRCFRIDAVSAVILDGAGLVHAQIDDRLLLLRECLAGIIRKCALAAGRDCAGAGRITVSRAALIERRDLVCGQAACVDTHIVHQTG